MDTSKTWAALALAYAVSIGTGSLAARETADGKCTEILRCVHGDLLETALSVRGRLLDAFLREPLTEDHEGRFVGMTVPLTGTVTSGFGPRRHPVLGTVRNHNGVDIAAPTGTDVRTVAPGTVRRSGTRGNYGLAVEIDHGNGITTLYAHLSRIDVRDGEQLPRAGRLGAVGSTGLSTGPHLHFEIRRHGEPEDPLRHLDPAALQGETS